jgi:hypothetical protein
VTFEKQRKKLRKMTIQTTFAVSGTIQRPHFRTKQMQNKTNATGPKFA